MVKKILIFLVMILISVSVGAVSITPGTARIPFEPFLEKQVGFQIYNDVNVDKEYYLEVWAKTGSDIEKYVSDIISVDEQALYLKSGEKRPIIVHVSLPYELPPGIHRITVSVMPKEERKGQFSAFAVIGYVIRIEVPFPGKYLKTRFKAPTSLLNTEESKLQLYMYNLGTEKIENATGIVDLFFEDERIITAYTDSYSIESKAELYASVPFDISSVPIGEYYATGTVRYDGKVIEVDKYHFNIGDLFINTTRLSKDKLITGGINKMDLYLLNMWNKKIEGVYGIIRLYDLDGEQVLKFKTQTLSVLPWKLVAVPAYFDTSKISPGNYTVEVELRYQGESSKSSFPLEIVEGVLEDIEDVPLPSWNPWTLIGIAVGVLIILNIILIFVLKRKRNY